MASSKLLEQIQQAGKKRAEAATVVTTTNNNNSSSTTQNTTTTSSSKPSTSIEIKNDNKNKNINKSNDNFNTGSQSYFAGGSGDSVIGGLAHGTSITHDDLQQHILTIKNKNKNTVNDNEKKS